MVNGCNKACIKACSVTVLPRRPPRGMWNQWDSKRGFDLVQPMVREEWWWPWEELPRPLKLAAGQLGYDGRHAWRTEEFKHSGQRFLDWEEVEMDKEGRASDGAGSVSSDSELMAGHDEANGIGRCGCMDTMDLLAEPSRRSYCQGPFATYRPRGGYLVGSPDPDTGMYPRPTDYMYCRPDGCMC